jgi:excisionase family DNA binding protein
VSTKAPQLTRDQILARRLPPQGREVLDLVEAAAYLHVSKQFLRRRIADKTLPAHQVGRLIRVYLSDLDALRQPVGGVK